MLQVSWSCTPIKRELSLNCAIAGTYRIVYFGDYKNGLTGKINAFTGTSGTFTIS